MELVFKCAGCRKPIEFGEMHYLVGQDVYDPVSGMRFNSGQNYCLNCYPNYSGERLSEIKPKEEKIETISSLKAEQQNVNVLVTVIMKEIPIPQYRNGRKLMFCQALIEDESGRIYLKLWNNIIEEVNVGDVLHIKNAYVTEMKGFKKLTLGNQGIILKINNSG